MNNEYWMSLALKEAEKGIGHTAPNPPVGAVIVKDGILLGKGWHQAAGRPHAEREALADVFATHGPKATQGATCYITLEPCSTHGRTPPCTQGLIDAGISRVVYATVDRNPSHAGRADSLLRAAGIEVVPGVGEAAAIRLLRPFFKVRKTGLPWVIWKSAMSLDGRITRPPGEGQWLTGPAARADVQVLRSTVDAIITSGETFRVDKPALTIRQPELLAGREQPWRVIVTDFPESLPQDALALHARTLIRPRGDLPGMLRRLASEQGVLSVMVEAGGLFSAKFFEENLVDEGVIYYAPLLCGGPKPALGGAGLAQSLALEEISYDLFDDDLRMRGILRVK